MNLTKRPLLLGVVAFVSGGLAGWYPYMTMGLGMMVILFLIWMYRIQKKREQAMPVLMILLIICLFLGMWNGYRIRIPDPLRDRIRQTPEKQIVCTLEGSVLRVTKREEQRVLLVRTQEIRHGDFRSRQAYVIQIYENNDKWSRDSAVVSERPKISVGNQIRCETELRLPAIPTNPGEFHQERYYQAKGMDFLGFAEQIIILDDHRAVVRQSLLQFREKAETNLQAVLSPTDAGALSAMLLGDTYALDTQLRTLYRRNGISHILAISALHISLLGSTLYRLLRKSGGSYWHAGIPVAVLLLAYGWMTGFSSSTLRAVIMFLLAIGADLAGRTYDLPTAAGIACLLLLVDNPYRLADAGFLLSFSCVLTLGFAMPVIQGWTEKYSVKGIRRRLLEALLSGIAIQVMTAPILAAFYYEIPTYGMFLNLIVVPCMTPLLLCGCLGMVCYPFFPWLGSGFLMPCKWILYLFRLLCQCAEKLPFSVWRIGAVSGWKVGLYYGIVFLVILCLKYRKRIIAVLTVCFYVLIFLVSDPPALTVTMLDVGQGDGIFIETPDHKHLLIDGGSSSRTSIGNYVLLPAMRYYGTDCLDYIFISHMDRDHISGLEELIDCAAKGEISIRYMVLPERISQEETAQMMIQRAEACGIQVVGITSGDRVSIDEVELTCLYPYIETGQPVINRQKETDANNDSMVLSLSYREFDMLFTGDLETEGEWDLMDREEYGLHNGYDVLKVGHHGSSGSSGTAFLQAVHPTVSLISCGRNNTYGHPHPETLERLEAVDSQVFTTANQGAIEIRTNGKKMKLHVLGFSFVTQKEQE